MDVFHLFPPIDEIVAQSKARSLHIEAINASNSVLETLLESLPIDTNEEQTTEDTPQGEFTVQLTQQDHSVDEPKELSTNSEQELPPKLSEDTISNIKTEPLRTDPLSGHELIGQPPTCEIHEDVLGVESPVSDEERMLDKEARSLVLLKLLQLACSMVSSMPVHTGVSVPFVHFWVMFTD